jgi:hypothetical protein
MQRNLNDPIYATSIQHIDQNSQYQVIWEKDGQAYKSQIYTIEVFDYPKIEIMEVIIASPSHYDLTPQSIINPESIQAYKGSSITIKATFNVQHLNANMLLLDQSIAFKSLDKNTLQQQLTFDLENASQVEFHLTDTKGRKNPLPYRLDLKLLKNKQPKIEVILPKRDIELTSISELPLKAKVKDDVALLDWGLELYINGYDPILISHQNQSSNKSPTIDTYIPLELYDLREKDVLSYHFYATDLGLDKKERKVFSDLYYVQIRPFMRSYVKNKPKPGKPSGDILTDFVNQQKEVVAALFNLKKHHHQDVPKTELEKARDIISNSQAEIAELLQKKINDMPPGNPALSEKLSMIQIAMVKASGHQAETDLPAHNDQLQGLLSEAQAILSELFKLRSAMVKISQQNKASSSNASQKAKMQKKKKLKLAANSKYKEDQKDAQEKSALSKEMRTLHALQELAQRQLDLNREMESLLAQLEKAKEKEELMRKLKKLHEEQQQLQKDAQAMKQQMQNSKNPEMQSQKENLEKSSQAMAQASKDLSQKKLDEALASSQKAQRELQNAERQMREQSSQKLGEKMNQLSQQARELTRQLEQEQQETRELQQNKPQLSNADQRQQRAESIEQRKQDLNELLNSIESVTKSSDNTQKALSSELYRALRQAKTDRIEQDLEDASELTQHGIYSQALKNLDEGKGKAQQLSTAIDRATELILGDESKALAQAQSSLKEFSNLIENEMKRLNSPTPGSQKQSEKQSGQKPTANQQQPSSGHALQQASTSNQTTDKPAPSKSSQKEASMQFIGTQKNGNPGSSQQSSTGQSNTNQQRIANGTGNSTGLFNQPKEIKDWLLKLRNVEQLVRNSDQRQNLSGIRDRLRELYHDQKRQSKPPQANTIQQKIQQPLVQLLKKMDASQLELLREKEQIQIDRDPIPDEFKKMVQEYFLNLSESE